MNNKKAKIIAIAAIGKDRAIGKDNELLWRIPDDMKRFKNLTEGCPIIMGRKTYESLPENYRPLPNRDNIIITRSESYIAPGAVVKHSIEESLEYAKSLNKEKIFIGGGAEIYKQFLPFTNELYLTIIDSKKEADSFFPDYSEFNKVSLKEEKDYEGIKYTWINLKK